MPKLFFSSLLALACFFTACAPPEETPTEDYDLVVYGGSSAGVIAACAAARLGKTALLVSPDRHLGGLSSSGLGATDVGNKIAVTGMARQFYRDLGRYYDKPESWTFEPHRAEALFDSLIVADGVTVWRDHHLESLEKDGKRITALSLVTGDATGERRSVTGRMFVDATYVGDLLAAAGVSFTIGRESNATYGETINGVQVMGGHQFPSPGSRHGYTVDPYVVPGDSTSGLLYGISDYPLAPEGSGDTLMQAYNYRLCLTQREDNRIPFTRPAGYDSTHYALLGRLIQERARLDWVQDLGQLYLSLIPMPHGKTDVNNKGPFSTDFIGENYDYPAGDRATRRAIEARHESYIRGLLYYLRTDPSVVPELRAQVATWGWAADEFTDNDYFPYKIYIREGRRMIGEHVMTEHHCRGTEVVEDPIGLAAYTMDSHNCQRIVQRQDGKAFVKNEGNVEVGGFPPFPIAYRSLVPKRAECANLLVPVCLSASHIAYGSIRMEPVFMVLGQTAALAASMAIDGDVAVQDVPVASLIARLQDDPLFNGTAPDILVDNLDSLRFRADASFTAYTRWMGQYNTDAYLADNGQSGRSASFTLPVREDGSYEVFYYVPKRPKESADYVTAASGVLKQAGRETAVRLPLRGHEMNWVSAGVHELVAAEDNQLEIVTDGTSGVIVADAVLLLPRTE